jgi:hypothetical protein
VTSFPETDMRISSPAELKAVLKDVKRCIGDGSLRLIRPAGAAFAIDDLAAVPEEGPWPDFLEAYFEDGRGTRYRLAVETYHGTGGSWRRDA